MSRSTPVAGPTISLFPFLAVLLCTMGSLLVLLVLFSRSARQGAESAAVADVADLELARESLGWRVGQLEGVRDRTADDLANARLQLAGTEEHARALADELEKLERMLADLDGSGPRRDGADLAALEGRLDAARQALDKARAEGKKRPAAYAVVPYVGRNGTHRRPLYVECCLDGVFLQPEGVRLSPGDFEGPPGPGNPLACALRAAREHIANTSGPAADPAAQPYPLLLVRPSGVMAYYAAREAIQSWGSDFGYQLVEEDWTLTFPPRDPTLADVEKRAVDEARQRLAWLAEMRPAKAPRPAPKYRAASTRGGVVTEGGPSVLGDQSRFEWKNQQAVQGAANGSALGAGGGDGTGSSGGGTGAGGPGGGVAPGRPLRAGEPQAGGAGSGSGPGEGDILLSGRPGSGGGGRGQAGSGPAGASGGGAGGAGSGAGNGTADAAGSASATASTGGRPGGGAAGPGALGSTGGAAGSPGGDGAEGGSGGGGGSVSVPVNAAGAAAGGGGAAAGSGTVAGSAGAAAKAGAGGGQSMAGAAAVPMPGLMQSGGSQSGGSQQSAGGAGGASAEVSMARARGRNWASLATHDRPIPLTRPIQIECALDEFRLLDDGGRRICARIPVDGDTASAVDPLVKAVHARVADWGLAGERMYWKPQLVLSATADGRSRRDDLERLLADSGIDTRHAGQQGEVRRLPPVQRTNYLHEDQ